VIVGAFSLAYREIAHKKTAGPSAAVRTQTDIPMLFNILLILLTALLIFVFFYAGVVFQLAHALAGLLIVLIISFLFTTVAANATAIVGTNPVSGMTLMTLILSSIVLTRSDSRAGRDREPLIIAGSSARRFQSRGVHHGPEDRYGSGRRPKKQETWKFLGVLVLRRRPWGE